MNLALLGAVSAQRNSAPVTEYSTIYNDNYSYGTGSFQYNYVGTNNWNPSPIDNFYNTDAHYSTITDEYFEFKAIFRRFEWFTEKFPTHGIAAISVDGGPETDVNLYNASPAGLQQQLVHSSGIYPEVLHTIKVRVTGRRDPLNTTNFVVIHDYFKIFVSTPAPVVTGTLYVDQVNGSDAFPGSVNQPFATITKAATVAVANDTVIVKAGTYRETIVPTNSGTVGNPINFIADPTNRANVIISGCNTIADNAWSVDAGNVYKCTLANGAMFTEYMTGFDPVNNFQYNNTQLLAQQIFKGGEMQILAQWPKAAATTNLLERGTQRAKANTSNFSSTSITDTALGSLTNLNGAIVWINGWFLTYTRTINSHVGNTINFNFTDGSLLFSRFYRVMNKRGLLTQAGEWHYESNILYYWQVGNGSPTGIEYKARNWGFDLRNRSNINFKGFNFIGCDPVMTNASSANINVDNIRAKYMNHSVLESRGGQNGYSDSAVQTGSKLMGTGNSIKNSEFRYAAGMAVWAGAGAIIQNNYFSDIDYCGQYSAAIKLIWGADNVKILNNTGTRFGRGMVELTQETNAAAQNLEIGYNDMSMCNMMNVDGGAIYSSRNLDHTGLVIHHNWFHDSGANYLTEDISQSGILVTGAYFDQASGPCTYHHNVHWNGYLSGIYPYGNADFYNDTSFNGTNGPSFIYNNTFASTVTASSYACYDAPLIDIQQNNIYRGGIWLGPAGTSPPNLASSNNLKNDVNPNFRGTGGGGLNFRVNSGSPAINTGAVIPGITDGSVGNPDIGAYEFGAATDWVPGYNAAVYTG